MEEIKGYEGLYSITEDGIFGNSPILQLIIPNKFWRLLAIDQLVHVLLNLILAWFLEVLF